MRKSATFVRAAMLFALAAVASVTFAPDAFAAVSGLAAVGGLDLGSLLPGPFEAQVTLAALRTQHADVVRQAEALMAQVNDDTPAERAREIEGQHADLVRQAETLNGQIAERQAAEAEEARRQSAPPTPDAAAITAAVEASLRAERERTASIGDIGRRAGMDANAIDTAIRQNTAVEAFRAQAFEHMATRAAQTVTNPVSPSRIEFGRDERDGLRDGMSAALVARMQRASNPHARIELPEHARAYGEMGLPEMAAHAIGYRGHLRTSRQVADVFERAFHTTSDFPGIFTNALNVRLLARYALATPAYRRFCAFYSATDFRPVPVVRAGDFPSLQPVNEAGEIKAGTFGESKEQFQVFPYGVTFNLSRHMLVNDQLGAIDQVLGSTGDRVADWENAQAFERLAANPTLLTDSVAVFHATHNNLAGAGTAITVAAVGAGRAAMMKQKTLDGLKANFTPATLLCGPDKITEAEQLVTTITPAQNSTAVPESIRRIAPVGDANITGNTWFLFADPAVAPAFVYGYLEGFTGPRLSFKDHWNTQGVGVKLEHDFGTAAIDYRPAYRNAGA